MYKMNWADFTFTLIITIYIFWNSKCKTWQSHAYNACTYRKMTDSTLWTMKSLWTIHSPSAFRKKKKIKKLGWGRVMVVSVIKSIAYSCAHLCLHLHVGQDILWDPMSDSGWLHSLLAAQSKQNLSHLSFTPTFHARWMHVNVPLFPCGECFV